MLLLTELLGAIGLLLWGLRMVRTGVMRAYGTSIKRLSGRSQGSFGSAFTSGAFIAAILQSSTATAMIASSFAGKSILTVTAAFHIILGADIGTAVAVFVASQKITWISPALIAFGAFGFFASDNHRRRNLFRAFLGLGLILLALSTVSSAGAAFSQLQDIKTIVGIFVKQPVLLVGLAIVITYLAHSSLAIILIAIGFVNSGFIDLPAALYFVLGANIGSGLLPIVASWYSPTSARVPVTANFLIRAAIAIVAFFFVGVFLDRTQGSIALPLIPVIFHLALNLVVVAAGRMFTSQLIRYATSLLPDKNSNDGEVEPKFLDQASVSNPAAALACAKREALHMAEITQKMVQQSYPVLLNNDSDLLEKTVEMDDGVDRLFNATKLYVSQMLQKELTEEESDEALSILSFTANMEHIGDIVDGGLMEMAGKKIKAQFQFSDDGLQEISALYESVTSNFDLAVNTFVSSDTDLARQLYSAKSEIRKLERDSVTAHFERIGKGLPESVSTSSLHLDVVRDLKRINSHIGVWYFLAINHRL